MIDQERISALESLFDIQPDELISIKYALVDANASKSRKQRATIREKILPSQTDLPAHAHKELFGIPYIERLCSILVDTNVRGAKVSSVETRTSLVIY